MGQVDPKCAAFQRAIDIMSRPWNGKILVALIAGPRRFSELGTGGLGDKTLSARLKELEGLGLIHREVEPGPPVRVLYSLTAKGQGFGHVSQAIERWGRDLVADTEPAKSLKRKAV